MLNTNAHHILVLACLVFLVGVLPVNSALQRTTFFKDSNCLEYSSTFVKNVADPCTPVQSCTSIVLDGYTVYQQVTCPTSLNITSTPQPGHGNVISFLDTSCKTFVFGATYLLDECTQDIVYTTGGAIFTTTQFTSYSNRSCALPISQPLTYKTGECFLNNGASGFFNANGNKGGSLNTYEWETYLDSNCNVATGPDMKIYVNSSSCYPMTECVKISGTPFYGKAKCVEKIPQTPDSRVAYRFYKGSKCEELRSTYFLPMYKCVPHAFMSGKYAFFTESTLTVYSDSNCKSFFSEDTLVNKLNQCLWNGEGYTASLSINNANTRVMTAQFTDSSCTTLAYSSLSYATTCVPSIGCSALSGSSYYGYVTCPSSVPNPRLGEILFATYTNTSCTQRIFSNKIDYLPMGVCVRDYKFKAITPSTVISYNDMDCTSIAKTTNVTNGQCAPNSSDGLYIATNGNVQTNSFITYTAFTDSACTMPANVKIFKKSNACIPLGDCVQIPGSYLYGTIGCSVQFPSPTSTNVLRISYTGIACKIDNLEQAHLYSVGTCASNPLISGGYVKSSSCGTISYYGDNNCLSQTSSVSFTSGGCIPNGNDNTVSYSCQSGSISATRSTQRTVSEGSSNSFGFIVSFILIALHLL